MAKFELHRKRELGIMRLTMYGQNLCWVCRSLIDNKYQTLMYGKIEIADYEICHSTECERMTSLLTYLGFSPRRLGLAERSRLDSVRTHFV